ncbi:MAG: DUF4430 domain-containing protein [Lachnospiraceae bacterium]|nr:DUF4430 domain-containing protein [Lachnospiraceae bacterium]
MKVRNKKFFSLLLCMMLTVAMAFSTTGCSGNNKESEAQTETQVEADAQTAEESDVQEDAQDAEQIAEAEGAQAEEQATEQPDAQTDATVLGEGQTVFTFNVTDADGNETNFEIHTDKETVGDALLELNLIAGEDSEYGLYVKTVNGITADYDKDQTYWAFYVNGEYAQTGVDSTNVTAGDTYSFKVEK